MGVRAKHLGRGLEWHGRGDLARHHVVTSDAHAGLVAAIGATLPAAAWQRCRTHYAANHGRHNA